MSSNAFQRAVRASHTRASRLVALTAFAVVAGRSATAADWDRDNQAEFGGVYSTDCANPGAPRLRATDRALIVEVGNQRMTGGNVQISASFFGPQELPPGEMRLALLSEVRGGAQLIFVLRRDAGGQSIRLDGEPKVLAALGRGLAAQTFRDCDAARSDRVAAKMRAEAAQARGERSAARHAARQPDALRFKSALRQALGPKVNETWLQPMLGLPGPETPSVRIGGRIYQELNACKPHDCGDNNVTVLYEPAAGAVYGKALLRAVPSYFGAPPPALAVEIDRRWRAQWRQGR